LTATDARPADNTLLLQALLDGELDASGAIEMERRLGSEPNLAAEYARLVALRGAIRNGAAREVAPESLRARVAAMAGVAADSNVVKLSATARPPTTAPSTRWRTAAMAMAAALVALIGVDVYRLSTPGLDELERAAVAGHARGLISGQPVDVVSTDRHTVKPWLATKVALATTVVDLASDGYALAGGRVDIINDAPAPTLVYRHREHFVSVTELPRGAVHGSSGTRDTLAGHSLVVWADNVRSYVAVSDMSPPELDNFVAIFRRAVASDREDNTPAR
jgi:anti-sigma factor RsiW